MCVCLTLASNSSETIKVIHVLIILTLTFIQGHTDLNNENTKCLIISETVQAMSNLPTVNSP